MNKTIVLAVYRVVLNGQPVAGSFPSSSSARDMAKMVWISGSWRGSPRHVVVRQNVRGYFNSEGTWRFFRDYINDGICHNALHCLMPDRRLAWK